MTSAPFLLSQPFVGELSARRFRWAVSDERAEREYLQLLKLAAEESEELVAETLRVMVERGEEIRSERVREMIVERRNERLPRIPKIEINMTSLASYDLLLGGREVAA